MDILIRTAYYCLAIGGSMIMVLLTLVVGVWIFTRAVEYFMDR